MTVLSSVVYLTIDRCSSLRALTLMIPFSSATAAISFFVMVPPPSLIRLSALTSRASGTCTPYIGSWTIFLTPTDCCLMAPPPPSPRSSSYPTYSLGSG